MSFSAASLSSFLSFPIQTFILDVMATYEQTVQGCPPFSVSLVLLLVLLHVRTISPSYSHPTRLLLLSSIPFFSLAPFLSSVTFSCISEAHRHTETLISLPSKSILEICSNVKGADGKVTPKVFIFLPPKIPSDLNLSSSLPIETCSPYLAHSFLSSLLLFFFSVFFPHLVLSSIMSATTTTTTAPDDPL